VQRLRELAWIDGRTVAIEYRWAERSKERFGEIAAEFLRLKVDVIVISGAAVAAAKQATAAIPIVFAIAARLPTIFGEQLYVEAGGLMSYGLDISDLFRRFRVGRQTSARRKSPVTCGQNSRPSSIWSSISRPRKRLASNCHQLSLPAQTR
jgi:hypothetical protein